MSNQPPQRSSFAGERAVDLRARGYTWDQVAERVHKKIEEIREWPQKYAEFDHARRSQTPPARSGRPAAPSTNTSPTIWRACPMKTARTL